MGFSVFVALSILSLAVICYKIASKEIFTSKSHLSWFSLFATLLVTQIGSSSFLYTAELAYYDGIFAILYPLGTSMGLLALGLGIGTKLDKLQLSDVSDVFYKHYRSEALRKASSLLLFASLLGLLVAQVMALKELLKTLGVNQELFFVAIWMSIVFLSLQSMMKITVRAEIFQTVVIITIFSVVYCLNSQSSCDSILLFNEVKNDVFEGVDSKLSSYLLMPCFFVFFEPKMIQTIPFARSKRKILTASLFSGLILFVISFVPAYCGITGKAIGMGEQHAEVITSLANSENSMLTQCCTCILLFAIVCGALSLLRSLAARIKEACIYHRIAEEPIHTAPSFSFGTRCWTLAIGVIALIASYSEHEILDLIFTSYELVVVCLFIPLVKAALSDSPAKISKLGAALSMIFGALSFCLCHLLSVTFFPEMISLAVSWFGFSLGQGMSTNKYTDQLQKEIAL